MQVRWDAPSSASVNASLTRTSSCTASVAWQAWHGKLGMVKGDRKYSLQRSAWTQSLELAADPLPPEETQCHCQTLSTGCRLHPGVLDVLQPGALRDQQYQQQQQIQQEQYASLQDKQTQASSVHHTS